MKNFLWKSSDYFEWLPLVITNWRMQWKATNIRWYDNWQRILPQRLIIHCWNWMMCVVFLGHDDKWLFYSGTCSHCGYQLADHEEREARMWEDAREQMVFQSWIRKIEEFVE